MSKKRAAREKKRQPMAFIIGFGILAIALYLIFGNDLLRDVRAPEESSSATDDNIETRFREDGTLTFYKADGTVTSIAIEIAETDQARTQGLMGRKVMQRTTGMLFIFSDEEPRSFWMVNTPLSLDIIYVNGAKQIVKIHPNTKPYSDLSLPSDAPAQYTVEVIGGFCAEEGIQEGDRIDWMRM